MARFLCVFILIALSVYAQENAERRIPSSLLECYRDKYLLQRENRLPHTLNTFLAILRKIESVDGLNMDLRMLSVALLQRFRLDGITRTSIPEQDGVLPYDVNKPEFYRHMITLKYIPGSASTFPNNSLTAIERCTLHFMLSDTIEDTQRGDEAMVCKSSGQYRYVRDAKIDGETDVNGTDDEVETFTPAEIEKDGSGTDDPNSLYPDKERLTELPRSKCPVHSGVVKTPWGTAALGLVLAGIAAGVQPEFDTVSNLQRMILNENVTDTTKVTVYNEWFATLAGDLAELALKQGLNKEVMKVGVDGVWNSTALPRWFFLSSDENYEITVPEIRGDLDGLILAKEIKKGYSNKNAIRLSQVFDMYYSEQGFFDSSIRACNRKTLFSAVAPNATMSDQAFGAAVLLERFIAGATIARSKIKTFAVQAVNALVSFVPTMDKDISCETDKYDSNSISTDLTIILDTDWEFSKIKPTLANLLENVDVNPYNSNFTLMNGRDGSIMIQSTSSLLDFHSYNSSFYENVTSKGFDLPKSLKELETLLLNKLENERNRGIAGARSDVVLIIPRTNIISNNDKYYCVQTLSRLREKAPDTTILIATSGSKDTWSDLVRNSETDLFIISVEDTKASASSIDNVVSRIKEVPKRLINTQCGSSFTPSGTSNSYQDYILSNNAVNIYKLAPNYFYNGDNSATITIKVSSSDSLTVCSAREQLRPTNDTVQSKSCAPVTNGEHSIPVSCAGASFIHECAPLYISITSNSTSSFQCFDARVCRYPNMVKYTISYENLVCTSDATKIAVNSFLLMIILVFFNL